MKRAGLFKWVVSKIKYNLMLIQIKSGSSKPDYVLFDIGLDLNQLKGTAGPWWRYALHWVPF